jgi:tripeptide aminopeptidase
VRKAPSSPLPLVIPPPRALRARGLGYALLLALATAVVALPAAAQTPTGQYVGEAKRLEADPVIQKAFDRVKELDPWGMKLLLELTQIPAPPFKEHARAERYAELLKEAGADSVWIDEEGNVLALRRGLVGQRTVALAGHLDTVFPEGTDVTVHQRGDTLFAPGIGDDTRGLIVVLTALRAMVDADVRTRDDLLFVGVVGEEGLGDLRGMKHLFRDGARPIAAWVDIDGGDLDGITAMGLGSVRYRVTFKGPGGHSWGAFGLANPAHALARTVTAFENVADIFTRRGPRTSYNVGVIGGGTSVNAIPFESWMEVDMRSESPASLSGIEAAFLSAVQEGLAEENAIRRRGDSLTVDLKKIGDRPSGEQPEDTPLVQRAMAATAAFGADPSLNRSSTDSNIPISRGIPAVTLGRGGIGGGGHSPGEWWINRDAYLAVQRAMLVVVAEAGLRKVVG